MGPRGNLRARVGSYVISVTLHASVLLAGPCASEPETLVRVTRVTEPRALPPDLAASDPGVVVPDDRAARTARTEVAPAVAAPESVRPDPPRQDPMRPPAPPPEAEPPEAPLPDVAPDRPRDRVTPVRPPPPPEPERPAPRPAPDPPPRAAEQVRVVRTDESAGIAAAPEAESAHDREAIAPRRAPITAPLAGPSSTSVPESTARAEAGSRARAEAPVDGDQAPEEPQAPAPATAAVDAVHGTPGVDGDAEPEPDTTPAIYRGSWRPLVTRVVPQAASDPEDPSHGPEPVPDGSHAEELAAAASPARDAVAATQEAPPPEPERAEPSREGAPEDAAPAALERAPATREAGATARGQAEGDAATDARDPRLDADGAALPTLDATATARASHQTVVDAPLGDAPAIATKATPRGRWFQEVDEEIRKRWATTPLPAEHAGRQVRAEVTVRFTIHPNGRTADVAVVRRSGDAWLDAIAVEAIPARVQKMPADVGTEPITHEITFRYR